MSEISQAPDESADARPAASRHTRSRWQVGLRTLLLLTAGIAVWLAHANNRLHNTELAMKIKALIPLAHELNVEDPKLAAVVKLDEEWDDDNGWDIYLPAGQYDLCIATRGIGDKGLVPPTRREPIAAGRHRIKLVQQQLKGTESWRVAVIVDGSELLSVAEPKEWNPGKGWSSSHGFSVSEQVLPDQPVELYRRTFRRGDWSTGQFRTLPCPCEGTLLWIEPQKKEPSRTQPVGSNP